VLSRRSLRRGDLEAKVMDQPGQSADADEKGAAHDQSPAERDAEHEGKPVRRVDEEAQRRSRAADDEGDDEDAASDQECEAGEDQERCAPNMTVCCCRTGSLRGFLGQVQGLPADHESSDPVKGRSHRSSSALSDESLSVLR
jgi:hypothetical protein